MADSTAEVFSSAKFTARADQSGLSGRVLAEMLGITPTGLSAVRNSRRAPSMEMLGKIVATLGGTPADYLDLPERKYWSLRHFRFAAGLTQQAVSAALGVPASAVSGWESQRYNPPHAAVEQLAKLYAVAESELAAVVEQKSIVIPAEGLLETAEAVIGLAESSLQVARTLDASRRRALTGDVAQRLEQTLEIMRRAAQHLPVGDERIAAEGAVRRLAELHEAAISASG